MKVSTSTDRRKRADIYRRAAQMIEKDDGLSCCAITAITKWHGLTSEDPLVESYSETFNPAGIAFGVWLDAAMDAGLITEDEKHGWRVLALCFMAAMVETGDA